MRNWLIYRVFLSFWGISFLGWQIVCFCLLWQALHPHLADGEHLNGSEMAGGGVECLLIIGAWLLFSLPLAALMLVFPQSRSKS